MTETLRRIVKYSIVFLVFGPFHVIQSQDYFAYKNYFSPPLNIPLYLSGNFGEIRSNHFHSGIDIKTQGRTGLAVLASADGYVSRIKIQAYGYGRALYITHPNGYTTVYGHLEGFREDIAAYLRKEHYKQKSYEVDIYLPKNLIGVKKNQLIAYSGNTGSSSGPHLHFEIRDQYQRPLNVLQFNLPVQDNLNPQLRNLYLYSINLESRIENNLEKISFPLELNNGTYKIKGKNPIDAHGLIGLGVETYDYLNGAKNRCGIFKLEAFIDGLNTYSFSLDRFSFNESRYVNSHIDYEEKILFSKNVHKAFCDPNNNLSIYQNKIDHGYLSIHDTLLHEVKIIVYDANKNRSELQFQIKNTNKIPFSKRDENPGLLFLYDKENRFVKNDIIIDIPAFSLYKNLNFKYARTSKDKNLLSDVHHIHYRTEPIHNYYQLSIRADSIPLKYQNKVLIVELSDKNEIFPVGGKWHDGFVSARVREFGRFALSIDTIHPSVLPLNFKRGANLQKSSGLKLRISDNFSGVELYEGYIDDNWVLFEYDPKNELIIHNFDPSKYKSNIMHNLKIIVKDERDNTSHYSTSFYW